MSFYVERQPQIYGRFRLGAAQPRCRLGGFRRARNLERHNDSRNDARIVAQAIGRSRHRSGVDVSDERQRLCPCGNPAQVRKPYASCRVAAAGHRSGVSGRTVNFMQTSLVRRTTTQLSFVYFPDHPSLPVYDFRASIIIDLPYPR